MNNDLLYPNEESSPNNKDSTTSSISGQTWSVHNEEVHKSDVVDVNLTHTIEEDEGKKENMDSLKDVEE